MRESAKTAGNPFQRSERFAHSELPDPLSYHRPDGTILRLPNYSPGTAFVEVDQRSGFQIRAKPLFPLIRTGDTGTIALPRFLLQIRFGVTLCYVRRYVASETSLFRAVNRARRWIDAERQRERFAFFLSPTLFLLVAILPTSR